MSLWYTYVATLPAWLSAVLSISVSIVGDKPMLNVFTKSIIPSSAYVRIYMLLLTMF